MFFFRAPNKQKRKFPETKVFSKQSNKDYMEDFHKHMVIVPVDKAAKNVGIICKAF